MHSRTRSESLPPSAPSIASASSCALARTSASVTGRNTNCRTVRRSHHARCSAARQFIQRSITDSQYFHVNTRWSKKRHIVTGCLQAGHAARWPKPGITFASASGFPFCICYIALFDRHSVCTATHLQGMSATPLLLKPVSVHSKTSPVLSSNRGFQQIAHSLFGLNWMYLSFVRTIEIGPQSAAAGCSCCCSSGCSFGSSCVCGSSCCANRGGTRRLQLISVMIRCTNSILSTYIEPLLGLLKVKPLEQN